ncbi:hypothetical protein Plim_0091 [Planctopirus limnophila DSM 3776]|uniref:Uncharacterized protein n=1 Tax=Planctopirus limnophila (strain ATCC 43296 / DSM 3776 / IFAM 1008 / Mu 290) TaxID=521674 RepID=D5SMM4_PLAL2|nr:hypothetical protein Plim_0091 [Planctopirus limnophila DSM 3776]
MEMPLIGHQQITRENFPDGIDTMREGSVSHRLLLRASPEKGIPNNQCC